MSNSFFKFKQFIVHQEKTAMKVTTDACLFGAWVAGEISKQKQPSEHALDIGTGTGLLTLMVAQQTNGHIDSIEIDHDACQQASDNASLSSWANRINIIPGDVQLLEGSHKYDHIFSNPPFYENELKSGNAKKDLAHHHDGLTLTDLLSNIESSLKPGGRFYLLLPYKRYTAILEMIDRSSLAILQTILVRQSVDHGYFRIMLEGSFRTGGDKPSAPKELSIRKNEREYTEEFVELLKPYYLYL